ncbi:MAG: acetoin utilization protein AcuC [Ornithinimicrobium sp.]
MIAAHVVWDQRFTAYDFGPGHPMHPIRLELTRQLSQELGLLDHDDVQLIGAEPLDVGQLQAVHSPRFVETVQRLSADPAAARGQSGIGTADTPAFYGMHEASALACGGTVAACDALWSGAAQHGVNIAGGLHHAMPALASGFCIYNDIALGIDFLLHSGAKRVLYVDLDVHHGDGVEKIFADDPRVLTISLHQSGRSLFPGTGFPHDTGGAGAPDSAVNVALPAGTDDAGWLRAFAAVVPPLAKAFAPEVIVSQHGCDSHYRDPLAAMSLTIEGMQAAYTWVHELAHEHSDGRWVPLGGGGYELVEVVPRAWTHLIGIATHRPVAPSAATSPAWREWVQTRLGVTAPASMGDIAGATIDYGSFNHGYDPEDLVDSAIMATRRAVFPGHGLDPYFD